MRVWTEGDEAILEVRDNGVGVPAEKIASNQSLGLIGMRERAATVGGDLRVESVSGKGTIVSLRVPAESATQTPP